MTNNYVMLNNVDHHNIRIRTEHTAALGDNINFVRAYPIEFRNIQPYNPILFRKDASTGEFATVALLGFAPGENLYLSDDGWDAHYVPLMIRRQPFIIGNQKIDEQPGSTRTVVSFDMNSPRVSETEGERLFLEHGGNSDFLVSITEMLETLRLADEMCVGFVKTLLELDLIEAVTMQVELNDGSKHELLGYYTINEDKLQKLDGDTLHKLNSEHYLEPIYMMLSSLSCFRRLIDRKNEQLVTE